MAALAGCNRPVTSSNTQNPSKKEHLLAVWQADDTPIMRRYHAATIILSRSTGRLSKSLQQVEVRYILGKPTKGEAIKHDSLPIYIDDYIFDDGTIKIVYELIKGSQKQIVEYRFVTYALKQKGS